MPGGRPDFDGVWLLDVTVGGHVYRYATEPVDVVDLAGRTFRYLEGLSEPGATLAGVSGTDDVSVGVEVQAELDWALLVQRGAALDRQPAMLRRWYPDRVLERARVVLRGLTTAPTYGALGEPLTFAILRSPRAQTRTIPAAQQVVDTSTWPVTATYTTPDQALGATYPLIIGAPGGTGSTTPTCVVPVPQVEYKFAATPKVGWIGGHAVQVRIQRASEDPPTELDAAVTELDDLLGQPVQTAPPALEDENGTYLIGFRDDATYGGGILNRRGELLRGAGDVIEWVLLEQYDGAVDLDRLAIARAYLNAWRIDTYVNTPVNAWDWLVTVILPLLPVEMREGPYGLYPAIIRWDVGIRDAVAHLDATGGSGRVTRDGPVVFGDGGVVNEVSVDFRPGAESGSTWLARRVVTARAGYLAGPDAAPVADSRILGSPLAAESQRRYGVRPLRIEAVAVWDGTTAARIAQHAIYALAWPRRAVRYVGGVWLEDLDVGRVVTLTDPELHLSRAVAVVVDVAPGPGQASVDLVLVDHPFEVDRSTD